MVFLESEEPYFSPYHPQTVKYVVTPKVGIYSVSELNKWFKTIIPDYQSLKPVNEDEFIKLKNFTNSSNTPNLYIAHLRFDEIVGHAEIVTTTTEKVHDETFLRRVKGFNEGQRIITSHSETNINRMIMIYGCPDEVLARYIHSVPGRHSLFVKDLTD